MRGLKVVHIVEAFGGGVYTFLKQLVLNDKNNEHIIIFSTRKETPNNYLEDFKGICLVNIPMQREIKFKNDLNAIKNINKAIRYFEPDILHLHSSKAGVYGRIINLLNFKRYQVIYNPHGLSFLQVDLGKRKRYIFKLIERVLSVISKSEIVGVSYQEYKIIKKEITKRNAVFINNSININLNQKYIEKKYDFATIGRICRQKNPDFLNSIAKKHPNKTFLWIGDGEERNLLTEPNIHITGWLDNKDEIFDYLYQSKIYIQLSLWEGLPIALLEAMSIGLPCLVSNCIGLKEVIEISNNGKIIYNIDEFDKLTKEINLHYHEYSQNSIFSIKNNYSLEDMIKKYNNLYLKKVIK